ncbi:MAG: hypothetical protein HY023_06520 [Chloroflexi bacterium]|nr:hypothetical protein [Chloroflexota bacterium]MBI3762136.1 hypothetical protein [Chloroflexota bacterium]
MTEPPKGVKTSAYIFFAYAGLLVLGLCAVIGSAILGATSGGNGQDVTAALIGPGIGGCVLIIFLALYAGVGYGLLKMMKWARIAAIVLSVLALCSFPIGTALGGYVLYLMFQEENKQAFA